MTVENGLTIGQMAQRTGLSVDTLRYYERIGLLRPIVRDGQSNHRRYSLQDCCDLAFVKILREPAMPLAQIRELLGLLWEERDTTQERLVLLEEHERIVREQLETTQAHLSAIQHKIARCQNHRQ